MKYSGADFKFTSQANHLQKLNQLRNQYTTEGFHLQRLYKRRKVDRNGIYRSTLGKIMEPIPDHPHHPHKNGSKKRSPEIQWKNITTEEDTNED